MKSKDYDFPAVRGIQAHMEYFITMVPIYCLPTLFAHKNEHAPAEMRYQRTLNKSRIREMCNYILHNPISYVFSALTATVDGPVTFQESNSIPNIGLLHIPADTKLLINDGQHRKAALEEALKQDSHLQYEHISMVIYHNISLKRSQQIFSDLNRFAIRPTQSLNILYDNKSTIPLLVKELLSSLPDFSTLVDKEHTSIPIRSSALFTLSSLYHGTTALLKDIIDSVDPSQISLKYWAAIYNNMVEWKQVVSGEKQPYDVRKESMSPHSITIRSLGFLGNQLIQSYPESWESKLEVLQEINWNKTNPLWSEIIINSSVQFSHKTLKLMNEILLKEVL